MRISDHPSLPASRPHMSTPRTPDPSNGAPPRSAPWSSRTRPTLRATFRVRQWASPKSARCVSNDARNERSASKYLPALAWVTARLSRRFATAALSLRGPVGRSRSPRAASPPPAPGLIQVAQCAARSLRIEILSGCLRSSGLRNTARASRQRSRARTYSRRCSDTRRATTGSRRDRDGAGAAWPGGSPKPSGDTRPPFPDRARPSPPQGLEAPAPSADSRRRTTLRCRSSDSSRSAATRRVAGLVTDLRERLQRLRASPGRPGRPADGAAPRPPRGPAAADVLAARLVDQTENVLKLRPPAGTSRRSARSGPASPGGAPQRASRSPSGLTDGFVGSNRSTRTRATCSDASRSSCATRRCSASTRACQSRDATEGGQARDQHGGDKTASRLRPTNLRKR